MLILTEFYLYNPYTWFRSPILARKYGKYYWGSGIHETKCNNKVLSYLCHSLHIRSWRSDLHHHLWTFGYYEGRTTFCCSSRRFQAARRQDLPIIVQLARRKTRWEEARLNFDVENRYILHNTTLKSMCMYLVPSKKSYTILFWQLSCTGFPAFLYSAFKSY